MCRGFLYWNTLRFSISSSICMGPVLGDFEIFNNFLCVWGSVLDDFEVFKVTPVCGPCTRRLWDFQNLLSLCVDSILGDFEIFNSFLVCGPCPGRLRFSIFSLCVGAIFPVCVGSVVGDFEILRKFPLCALYRKTLSIFQIFPCAGGLCQFSWKIPVCGGGIAA